MSNLQANRLELRSDLAELKRLAGWLKAQAQQELSADTSFAIQLCLEVGRGFLGPSRQFRTIQVCPKDRLTLPPAGS